MENSREEKKNEFADICEFSEKEICVCSESNNCKWY